jgi:hypothetical protein
LRARKGIVVVERARETRAAPRGRANSRTARDSWERRGERETREGRRSARNRRKRRARLIISLAAAALIMAGALLFMFLRGLRIHKFDSPTYHYDVGVKFAHEAGTVVERADDGITLTDERAEFPLGPIPVFSEGGRSFMIPDNMTVFLPQEGVYGKAGFFATVTENPGGGGYTLRSGNDRSAVPGGFLFDGRNQYIFLERAEVVWGEGPDDRVTLEPLSYMTVIYNLRIEIYPRDSEAGILLDTDTARVMAYMSDYSVDLSKDIMYVEGQEMLLFADPNLLKPYKR